MNYLEWIVNWFVENRGIPIGEINTHLDDNYFEMGYIDSFAFIMLISEIEEDLHISFDNDAFQDRSFSTINGLAKALEIYK